MKNLLIPTFFCLYPEIHYRLKIFPFSFYFKKEPEILIDIPHKSLRNKLFPVFLIIKAADKYNVHLRKLEIVIKKNNQIIFSKNFSLEKFINQPYFHQIFHLNLQNLEEGASQLAAKIFYEVNGKEKSCINDNFRYFFRKHESLPFYLNDQEFKTDEYYIGDFHTHSSYTADQVEFGAPLPCIKEALKSVNANFVLITDHSYDLDDYEDNYLKNDPNLIKFGKMKKETKSLSDDNFLMINGEELSALNSKGRIIHFLLAGNEKFYEGKGDGAENWLDKSCKYSIKDVVKECQGKFLMVPAHPFVPVPIFQYFLLKRGSWSQADILDNGLKLIQILNGENNLGFQLGLENWKQLLLAGKQVFICAGNDSHGNFTVFRQIEIPMIKLAYQENREILGYYKTVIKRDNKNFSKENLFKQAQKGASYITNGPFLEAKIYYSGKDYYFGDSICLNGNEESIIFELEIFSSKFRGEIKKISFHLGKIAEKKEIILENKIAEGQYNLEFSREIKEEISNSNSAYYIYLRIDSNYQGINKFSISNPVFVNTKS